MNATNLQRESAILQQILKSLQDLLIIPSRLTDVGQPEFGSGEYGKVSLAMLDGSSKVTVKQLRIIRSSGSLEMVRMATRFASDLKRWAGVNHPNILKLVGYHLGKNYSSAQLISPYMANGNIKQYMERDRTGIELRLCFVRGITSALEYLHSCDPSICHGALKPTNVLINDEPEAVLCDFGLSTFVEDSIQESFHYMCPELLQEVESDPDLQQTVPERFLEEVGMDRQPLRSEVWAWACTAFEIITDSVPYSAAQNGSNILSAVARGEPPGEIALLDGLIPESNRPFHKSLEVLRSAISGCWERHPLQRPPISHILRDLSSLPPTKSLFLKQQAAGRVERTNRITDQLVGGIEVMPLANDWKQRSLPQAEAVIFPPTKAQCPSICDVSLAPNGEWLATCLSDELPKLWNLEKDFDSQAPFPQANGKFLWSPDSQYLALIGKRGLHIWATTWESSIFYSTNTIDAITWFSDGDLAFVSEQRIYVMTINPTKWEIESRSGYIGFLHQVNGMASIPSGRVGRPRIALIAAGIAPIDSLLGSACWLIYSTWRSLMSQPPVSNSLLAYDTDDQKVVGDLLLMNTPRSIAITGDYGDLVLLSFSGSESEDYLELWSIEIPYYLAEPLWFKFVHRFYFGMEPDPRLSLGGRAIFGDAELLLATFRNGNTYLWEIMSKRPVLAIKGLKDDDSAPHSPVASFYKTQKDGRLACGLGNGKVVIWKF